jgi:hypothetical protein
MRLSGRTFVGGWVGRMDVSWSDLLMVDATDAARTLMTRGRILKGQEARTKKGNKKVRDQAINHQVIHNNDTKE